MKLIVSFILFIVFNQEVYSSTIMVPRDYYSIQDAINSSYNGDIIIVCPGTYYENINFFGKEITVKSEKGPDITIIDGCQNNSVVTFNSNEKSTSILNGFTITNGTGTQFGAGYFGGGIYCNNQASPKILNNIIIENIADAGGGIVCYGVGCDPYIINCKIINNKALHVGGGGILLRSSNAIVENCMIIRNKSDSFGGGINITYGSKPSISNNIIELNIANEHGGGICADASTEPTIIRNVIKQNKARDGGGICFYDGFVGDNLITLNVAEYEWNSYLVGYGGGIQANGSDPEICRNMIVNNSASSFGGGIQLRSQGGTLNGNIICSNSVINGNYPTELKSGGGVCVSSNSNILMNNNIIFNNKSIDQGGGVFIAKGCSAEINNTTIVLNCSNIGGGIYFSDNAYLNIVNNIIWKNRTDQIYYDNAKPYVSYSDIMGGFSGVGNIDADPRFVEVTSNDFHLLYDSPCRNTGDNNASNLPFIDFEGDPRIAYGTVDMGADEFYPHLYYTGDATPGGAIQAKFIGLPGKLINGVILGVNIFDPPLPCHYGLWYMDNPMQILTGLGTIPANGVSVIPGTIPASPAAPYTIYLQAAIDSWLTNLCTVNVE